MIGLERSLSAETAKWFLPPTLESFVYSISISATYIGKEYSINMNNMRCEMSVYYGEYIIFCVLPNLF